MEKIKLNVQIVSMRKYVKQAKVHVVNKLVKQVKLLQNRRGSEAKIQKAKRKAERYLEAVAIVKKIKPDEVTKLALLKAKNWKGILQEKNSSLHDRCIAMLANYGAVQKEVEAFYNANKELVLNISSYITEWEQKNKMPKNISKANRVSLEKKNKKIHINSKDESNKEEKSKPIVKTKIESNTKKSYTGIKISSKGANIHSKAQDSDSNADNKFKISSLQKLNNHNNSIKDTKKSQDIHTNENNSSKVNDLESSNEESGSEDNEESESNENNEESEIDEDNEGSECDENNKEEEMNSTNNNNKSKNKDNSDEESRGNNINKSELKSDSLHKKMTNHSKNNLKAIALLNLNELEGLDEIPLNRSVKNDESESSEDEIDETSKNNSSDPFFLSHNKEDSDAKELDSFSNNRNIEFRTKNTAHPFNYRTKFVKNNDFPKRDNHFISQKSEYNHKNNERKFKKKTFMSQSFDNKFPEKNKNNGDFRFKHKPYPLPVTYGKKEFKNNSKSYESKDNTPSKNKRTHEKGNTNEALHPSWEAKKKQKELLNTSFQGKRIVFND